MGEIQENEAMAHNTTKLAVRGKVVVITGAARGIGQEFARSLSAAGAADLNDCSATLDLIKAEKGKAIGVVLDVRRAESAADMTNAATRGSGALTR